MDKYSMEIQDQMNYFALKIGNQVLHCVLYFNGNLNEEILHKAIMRSLEIENILGCRLVKQDNLVFWEKRDDLVSSMQCEIIETTNVQKELNDFLIKDIDLENDPLLQVKVFRNSNDCLCIKISHTISDAGGLKNYVSLLAGLYNDFANGTETTVKQVPISDRSQKQIFQYLEPSVLAKYSEKSKDFFRSVMPNWSFPSKGYNNSKLRFEIVKIENMLFDAMKNFSKDKKVTLNDILLTAFCCSLIKEEGYPSDKPMIIQVPVDLRRYVENSLPICNMSGTDYLNIMIENNNFVNVLDKIHEFMQLKKADYPGLTSAFAIEFLSKLDFQQAMSIAQNSMEMSKQYNVSIPILTNMGIISDDCKKFGDISAHDGYLVSPIMYSPGFMLGVSSFDNTLTLTVGYSEDSIAMENIKKFMREIISQLKESCKF